MTDVVAGDPSEAQNRPSRALWTHVDSRPASAMHRRWVDVVATAAQRLGYGGAQAVVSAARLRGQLGLVSVFALSAPTTRQLRALIEELPADAVGERRLVDADTDLMRELRAAVPDESVAAAESVSMDRAIRRLLDGR